MTGVKIVRLACVAACIFTSLSGARAVDPPNGTLLFQNLRKLGSSFPVDNLSVAATATPDGPKGLATGDLDGDLRNDLVAANADGTVAVLFGAAGAAFEPARHLVAGHASGLRDVITANVLGDARPEIIAAHPFDGKLYIFSVSGGAGSRTILAAGTVDTWPGARAVAAGDFNGDGLVDLAVGGAGGPFQEYRGIGAGRFTRLAPLAAIYAGPFDVDLLSAKPVFTMHVSPRQQGENRDRLVVSFATSQNVWFLAGPVPGQPLAITFTLVLPENERVYDLATGYLSAQSRSTGKPDLLTAATSSGEVLIRRYDNAPSAPPYPQKPQQSLAVPGGPRAVSVSDVNDDDWPDLLVAARTLNTLFLYLNHEGALSLSSLTSAGSSPRDVVSADFDGNGWPDAAVINRATQDITVHRIDRVRGVFLQNPLVQGIEGGASAPSIRDLDGDGRSELLYLTHASGEANIQKLNALFQWLPPVRYSMGTHPRTLTTPDINGDGLLDLLSTSLGSQEASGGIVYRLQLVDHTFGPLITVSTPPNLKGAFSAEITGDFNGDNLLDLVGVDGDAVGDAVTYYEGTPEGLVPRRRESFVYQSQALAALDADQDGDLDLVGVGAYGDLAVVDNNGQWFTDGGVYRWQTFPVDAPASGAYALVAEEINGDGDPDLIVFAGNSVSRWVGGPGLTFTLAETTAVQPSRDATALDFDGDGIKDEFILSQTNTKASFYKGTVDVNNRWSRLTEEPYRVPSTSGLASGDLDGDGRSDLVGAGEYLWAALSRVSSPSLVPTFRPVPEPEIHGVVINEVLASTTHFIPPGTSKPEDCVEIFNGSGRTADLTGWRLHRVPSPPESRMPDYIFPSVVLEPGALAVIFCRTGTGEWDAPFKLPEEGRTLQLLDAGLARMDTVSYPAQQPDVSYARVFDGSRSFVANPFPSIGNTNYDNGNTEPKVTFKGLDMALLKAGTWRFQARAVAANGMFTLIVSWREVTASPTPRSGTIAMYDDGFHNDEKGRDGIYAGDWDQPLPPGTAIEFYVTGIDQRWVSSTVPDGPQFTPAGQTIGNYTLALPAAPSGWEISEVVPLNLNGLADEMGKIFDWAELRYTGSAPATVQDLFLSDALFTYDLDKLYEVSRQGTTVLPRSSRIVFLDGKLFDVTKPRHAPFKLTNDGDSIFLIRRSPRGATELVDSVRPPPELPPDTAFARMGAGGPFVTTQPTPGAPNARVGGWVHLVPDGSRELLFAFPGGGRVEASYDLNTWSTVMPWVGNDGTERTYREPIQSQSRFFRVR